MEKMVPNREQGYSLLLKYNQNDALIKHALAVEAVMMHFAVLLGEEDIKKWGIIGLVHDLDYELYPEQHCKMTEKLLKEENWPEEYIHAVVSHGWKICSDIEPIHIMEKVLYTIDELTGLIHATCLMRPSRSILDLTVSSVKKKFKQKSFAAGVDRSLIEDGAEMLNMELDYIIDETIKGMKNVAEEIGLKGSL